MSDEVNTKQLEKIVKELIDLKKEVVSLKDKINSLESATISHVDLYNKHVQKLHIKQ